MEQQEHKLSSLVPRVLVHLWLHSFSFNSRRCFFIGKKLFKSDGSTAEGLGSWLVVFLSEICLVLKAHTLIIRSQLPLLPNVSLNASD